MGGRHPIRQRQLTTAVAQIEHNIHVLAPLGADRLITYAIGVLSQLTNSLLKLQDAQPHFGQHDSLAEQHLVVLEHRSRLLQEFTDEIDSAINELSAVEFLAQEEKYGE